MRALLHWMLVLTAAAPAAGQSLAFDQNAPNEHEYGHQLDIPAGFGAAEFTLELWIRPDDSFPVGSTCCAGQLVNWSDADEPPYSSCCWWYEGNFLLDGHNNGDFEDGTFSLQFYGGGRVRWLFGDGVTAGPGGHWSVGAFPATSTPSLLDGAWHHVALVRRFVGAGSSDLELWIDGGLVDVETSPARTDMRTWWEGWAGFPPGQEGWFWGAEKQAAIGVLTQYEDYKGLVDGVRFWSRAKSAVELGSDWAVPVGGAEPGLVGWFRFDEAPGGAIACDALAPGCMDLYLFDAVNWSAEGEPGSPAAYCTAKVNSQGCTPAMTFGGVPSATSPAAFDLGAIDVLNGKPGLLFYGLSPSAAPFQGGVKCAASPVRRTPVQVSGGNPPPDDCSGTFSIDFNGRIQGGSDPALVPGQDVYAQYWSRDPQASSTTNLTDAVTFVVGS